MLAFTRHTGSAAPLDRVNVDTDQIIPKQYLKSIKRTGFGDYLFDGWRFNDEGDIGMTPNERDINRDFVLNFARYQGTSVLLARDNFGCGSSREHAVWSLLEYGFRVVIASSFADIFYGNCFKNGLLPIVLEQTALDKLFELAQTEVEVEVDLEKQQVSVLTPTSCAATYSFEIASALKEKMLGGMDDIAMTLEQREMVVEFEIQHKQAQPWLFQRGN
ncbi:MAG: 3-isopropylmalate dehydratase small subunit [Gammaproteobacteria bacterium]|nr:3-isopropylmalate dehydratase small subunit [Gammaproteobacteria bacterium]